MLYYLPAVGRPTREKLVDAGIAYAFEGQPTAAEVLRGPFDGPGGCVCADPRTIDIDRVRLSLDDQVWRKVPLAKSVTEHGAVCVGYWRDAPPGPDQLVRRSPLAGNPVELADERVWSCPKAIAWADQEPPYPVQMLPRALGVGDDGHWQTGEILPKYRALWDIAEQWHALLCPVDDGDEVRVEVEETTLYDWAARCLAANYRVSPIEIDMLGLFTHVTARRILAALLDEQGLREIQQKKTAD